MEIKDGVLLNVTDDDIGENGEFMIPEGVTGIGACAFYDCRILTSVKIPVGVTEIGELAFYGCENLTSVNIPEGVTGIRWGAFYGCKNLTSVNIPEGVTEIESSAFRDCESLTSVTILNGVTSIGDAAFRDCEKLKSAVIPNSVKSIGIGAFHGCNGLKTKPSNYKAFEIRNGDLCCLRKKYKDGVKHFVRGEIKMFNNGIHYCTNLFEIFNFYSGELDKGIAICEIRVGNKVLTSDSSMCCTNSCVLKKRLTREDIIKILNGEAV